MGNIKPCKIVESTISLREGKHIPNANLLNLASMNQILPLYATD